MIQKRVLFLVLILKVISGCSIFSIFQENEQKDADIQIIWEDNDQDGLKVRYENHADEERRLSDKNIPEPLILPKDSFSTEYLKLFNEIDEWLGTPYRHGKSEKNTGTDCSGFTMEIYKTVFGIELNRSSLAQVANTVEIDKEELQIGDLIFFNIRGNRISHVGIYIGNNKFAHATLSRGVMINDLDESYYAKRYERSGRVIRN